MFFCTFLLDPCQVVEDKHVEKMLSPKMSLGDSTSSLNDFWERKNSANIERNTPHFKNFQVNIKVAGQENIRNPCFTYS